jgi:tRNA U34 2-thiouridine synthase MnmA/TrmU
MDLTQINTDRNIRVDPRSNPRLSAVVEFLEPQKMIAPGQSIVFYKDELVLGGGIILKRTPLDSK